MNVKHTSLQILAATTLLTITHSVFALSCMPPDPVQICHQMQQQQLSPIWANGQLSLKEIISQEKSEMSTSGKGAAVADYSFTGTVTDNSGARSVKSANLRVTTSCIGPWCASLPQDKKSGYFLLQPNGQAGMKLHIGSCTFMPYSVTEQQKNEIEACVQSKSSALPPKVSEVPYKPINIPTYVGSEKPPVQVILPLGPIVVSEKPVMPQKVRKNRGGSQIYSQHNQGKKLVE